MNFYEFFFHAELRILCKELVNNILADALDLTQSYLI